jgi:hypothetical protein
LTIKIVKNITRLFFTDIPIILLNSPHSHKSDMANIVTIRRGNGTYGWLNHVWPSMPQLSTYSPLYFHPFHSLTTHCRFNDIPFPSAADNNGKLLVPDEGGALQIAEAEQRRGRKARN